MSFPFVGCEGISGTSVSSAGITVSECSPHEEYLPATYRNPAYGESFYDDTSSEDDETFDSTSSSSRESTDMTKTNEKIIKVLRKVSKDSVVVAGEIARVARASDAILKEGKGVFEENQRILRANEKILKENEKLLRANEKLLRKSLEEGDRIIRTRCRCSDCELED